MLETNKPFGTDDASYQAAGEIAGITQLVHDFYVAMDTFEQAQGIRRMHPKTLDLSRKKLSYFLSGWLGGPKLYAQEFGGISIPGVHQHMAVGEHERDAWLLCMQHAIDKQPYSAEFKYYLMTQLRVPAERIRQACAARTLASKA
ncbi:group II truncated hemoglobin [Alteromonadaceae bacterium BrNp21-10]|nr:group II truncated hemoglobin [Alteromonadaceae bacterium BrNp21-10]